MRQLEHRIENLPALADRLQHDRDQALREAATGREQAARLFKYAEQLADARAEQEKIERTITERHTQAQPADHPASDGPSIEPETAQSLRLLRPTQAHPVEDALHTPATAPAPSSRPARTATPRVRPHR